MDKRIFWVVISITFFGTSCDSTNLSTIRPDDGAIVFSNQPGPYEAPSDHLTILSASIQNRSLVLEVQFGGGCEDHDIGVIVDQNWVFTDPPKVRMYVTHNAKNDACRALVYQTRVFPLNRLVEPFRSYSGPVELLVYAPGETGHFLPAPVYNPVLHLDYLQLIDATVKNDSLQVTVQYGGGCREHDIDLLWSGDWAESLPPQVSLVLTHNANDDPCDAWITSRRSFSLRFLDAQAGSYKGDVILNIIAPVASAPFEPAPVYTIR